MHALSIPTWIIHILSVLEWTIAIGLVWSYAGVTQNLVWRGFSLAMLPAWVSAICVCTWHLFDNSPSLAWLGMAQAILTVIGNFSLLPYLAFLWFLTRSKQAPRLALVGFYFTLIFVGVTVPARIYTKVAYGESLANLDWLNGTAESLLTLSNMLIVLGFRRAMPQRSKSHFIKI